VRSRYRIHCVRRTDLYNHHLRIHAVAGVNPDGARWMITEAEAIAAIETGRWNFYVEQNGDELPIIVAVSKYGTKYLKGIGDRLHPDSLLALPECH
jgi:hypothetical protein